MNLLRVISAAGSSETMVYDAFSASGIFTAPDGGTQSVANNDTVGMLCNNVSANYWLYQPDEAARPLLQTAYPSIRFNGVNTVIAGSVVPSFTKGSISVVFKTGSTPFLTRGLQSIVSVSSSVSAADWFEVGVSEFGRVYVEINRAGVKKTVEGSTLLDASQVYMAIVTYDGADYYMQVNGVEQNPLIVRSAAASGWSDIDGADTFAVGGTITDGGTQRPFLGELLELRMYNYDVSI